MNDRSGRATGRKVVGFVLTIAFALVVSACSVGGGDDPDATSTSETGESTGQASQDRGATLPSGTASLSTPEVAETFVVVGSPAAQETTSSPGIVVSAPPIEMPTRTVPPTPASPAVSTATPQAVVPANEIVGDGTGGPGSIPSGSSQRPDSSTGGTPVASPVVSTTSATGCDFSSYPPYSGADSLYVTGVEANFRAGPGQDCEIIGEPLAPGVSVEVLSNPVGREGDTEFLWVFVSIDGTQGWLATEVLAPA